MNKRTVPAPLVVRPKEACALLNCSPDTLYRLLNSDQLASFSRGRARLIPMASIEGYVARRGAAGERPSQSTFQSPRGTGTKGGRHG
jgi:excisionase family DNA binding protein